MTAQDHFSKVPPASVDPIRKLFAKWLNDTDVAEQCGTTNEAILENVSFTAQPFPFDPKGY